MEFWLDRKLPVGAHLANIKVESGLGLQKITIPTQRCQRRLLVQLVLVVLGPTENFLSHMFSLFLML